MRVQLLATPGTREAARDAAMKLFELTFGMGTTYPEAVAASRRFTDVARADLGASAPTA